MKIGGVSSVVNKHMANTVLNKISAPNSNNNPFEKEKAQIQQQISQVENSKLSKDEKNAKIKELQESLQEVEQRETQERAEKKILDPESEKVNKEKEVEDEKKLKFKDDENNQVLNKDVVYGLASASTHMKVGRVAFSVYKAAKARGDMGVAKRALSYASGEFKQSRKSTKLIEKAISEYKKQLRNAKMNENSSDNLDKSLNDNLDKTSIYKTKEASTDNNVKENIVVNELNNSNRSLQAIRVTA